MKPEQPSATARVIAAATLLLDSRVSTRALVAPGAAAWCRRLLAARAGDRWLGRTARSPLTRWLWQWVERLTHPGIMAHWWRRKQWLEARTRVALAQGVQRVIVLGAGYDTLALRLLPEFRQVEWIEIDHPSTQTAKRRALADCDPASMPRFVPLDLDRGDALATVLAEAARAPTLVVAEGVLMYLQPASLDQLFATLRAHDGPLQLLCSVMQRWTDGSVGFRPRSRLIDRWLKGRGEPFTWAIAPEQVPGWLDARGWVLEEQAMAREFGAAGSALEGENLLRVVPRAA